MRSSWVRGYDKGRVFYTSLGHEDAVWNDPQFQAHLLGGIKWALGLVPGAAEERWSGCRHGLPGLRCPAAGTV